MKKIAAGLLLYRQAKAGIEVFLAHPGGPFFRKKDAAAWTIPKGEPLPGEDLLATAVREFHEETGITPKEPFLPLESIRQRGGKTVWAWAFEGNWSPGDGLPSNTFETEWPPRSGRMQSFPEIDRADFFPLAGAREKINPAQIPLLDRLVEKLKGSEGEAP